MSLSLPLRAPSLCRATLLVVLGLSGCAVDTEPEEPLATTRSPVSVGGCTCPTSGGCSTLSYSDIPADNVYYVTTFGGGADTQPMSCGGTADGTWAYVADSARFGCNSKLLIEAQGKSCVAEVRDCGPNRCVEEAACSCSCGGHFPIIDASPFITKYLVGSSAVGWSEKIKVTAKLVDSATPIGCPGGPVLQDSGAGGDGGAGAVSGAGGGAGSSGAPTSGGSSGSAGAAGSAGEAGAAGTSVSTKSSNSDGGCSCSSVRTRGAPGGWLALVSLFIFGAKRRSAGARARRQPRKTVPC